MENKTEVDLILNALHLFDVDSDPDAEVSRGCRSVTHEIDLNPPEPHFLKSAKVGRAHAASGRVGESAWSADLRRTHGWSLRRIL